MSWPSFLRYRVIGSGSSFGGNSLATTIRLGPVNSILTLEVYWPASGQRQTFHNVSVDRAIEITEGRWRLSCPLIHGGVLDEHDPLR